MIFCHPNFKPERGGNALRRIGGVFFKHELEDFYGIWSRISDLCEVFYLSLKCCILVLEASCLLFCVRQRRLHAAKLRVTLFYQLNRVVALRLQKADMFAQYS